MCARVDFIEYCLDGVVISFDIAPEWIRLELET